MNSESIKLRSRNSKENSNPKLYVELGVKSNINAMLAALNFWIHKKLTTIEFDIYAISVTLFLFYS